MAAIQPASRTEDGPPSILSPTAAYSDYYSFSPYSISYGWYPYEYPRAPTLSAVHSSDPWLDAGSLRSNRPISEPQSYHYYTRSPSIPYRPPTGRDLMSSFSPPPPPPTVTPSEPVAATLPPPFRPLRRSRLGTRLRALQAEQGTEERPRRPENAYILFRRSFLESQKAEGDEKRRSWARPRSAEVSKTIGLQWKHLSSEEKERWERLAREKAREREREREREGDGNGERLRRFSKSNRRRTATSTLAGSFSTASKPPSGRSHSDPTPSPNPPLTSSRLTDEICRFDMALPYQFLLLDPVASGTQTLPRPPDGVGHGDRDGTQRSHELSDARDRLVAWSFDNGRFEKRTKYAYHDTPMSRERRLPRRASSRCGDLWVPLDPPREADGYSMRDDLPDYSDRYAATFYRTHLGDISPENELDLTDYIDRGPLIATGGFGHVYRGKWKNVDQARLPEVVVKVVNLPVFEDERQKARRLKKLKREFELWSTLNHDNILPLMGIARIDGDSNMPAFVSPWMQDGSVIDFLNRNPSFPVIQFLYDVIKGLHYLHSFDPEIVHGDLKAANILVNHRREACLCDFGLSRFAIENTLWKTDATQANGTLRWMAPELLQADETIPTRMSDVYAYGMTCYEILSGKTPFESIRNDCAVMAKVIKGDRPDRVDECDGDDLWSLITQCWAQDPHDRPATDQVLLIMQDIASL